MSTVKAFRFPVGVEWQEGRLTRAGARDKPDLEVATPPEFKDGIEGVWSPEELLVASAASCFALTFVAVAEKRRVAVHGLHVVGTGHVERRNDGRLGFVVIDLQVRIETDAVEAAQAAARIAEELCIIRIALDTPLHVELDVRAAAEAAA